MSCSSAVEEAKPRAPVIYLALEKVRLAQLKLNSAFEELRRAERELTDACRSAP